MEEQWGHSAAYGETQLFFNIHISSACPSFWTIYRWCKTIPAEAVHEEQCMQVDTPLSRSDFILQPQITIIKIDTPGDLEGRPSL